MHQQLSGSKRLQTMYVVAGGAINHAEYPLRAARALLVLQFQNDGCILSATSILWLIHAQSQQQEIQRGMLDTKCMLPPVCREPKQQTALTLPTPRRSSSGTQHTHVQMSSVRNICAGCADGRWHHGAMHCMHKLKTPWVAEGSAAAILHVHMTAPSATAPNTNTDEPTA
jgi:hypothetical protein